MKNLDEVVNSLSRHNMFVQVENDLLIRLKKENTLKAYRNDGTGSRLMAYINLVRIAKKLKKKYIFYWDTRTDKGAKGWPHSATASEDISKYLPNMKHIKLYDSNRHKISRPFITEWKFLILKNEKKKDVIKESINILKTTFKNNEITKSKVKKKYNYGLHIRCGDISATTGLLTKNSSKIYFYKEEFNLGKRYPNEIWLEAIKKIKNKSIIVSDDYKYIKNKFKPKKNFFNGSASKRKSSKLFIFLKDIFEVSQAENVICALRSGAGLIIMLSVTKKFYTPEKFLEIEEIFFSFSKIIENNYYKFNKLNSLINHNIKYFGSKPIEKFMNFKNRLKKSL